MTHKRRLQFYVKIILFLLFGSVFLVPVEGFSKEDSSEITTTPDVTSRGKKAGKIRKKRICKQNEECPSNAKREKVASPDMMGSKYYIRFSYGMVRGTYSDTQENEEAAQIDKIEKLNMPGTRMILEAHPLIMESKPSNYHAYFLVEHRKDKPKADFWSDRQSAILALGMVIPRYEIIAPVIGVHWEFNEIDIKKRDSPEVAKAGIRALLIGLHVRQKIVGIGSFFSLFLDLRGHMFNPSFKNKGTEFEGGLGTAWQLWKKYRVDLTFGMLRQNYYATQDAGDSGAKYIKINSSYQVYYGFLSIWI